MGVYNTTQAFGLALGGILGGSLAKRFGDNAVFYVCAGLTALWFVAAWNMKPPSRVTAKSAYLEQSESTR